MRAVQLRRVSPVGLGSGGARVSIAQELTDGRRFGNPGYRAGGIVGDEYDQ